MTLVIVALGKDFVVLGADSRGTTFDALGNRVELNIYRKIVPFNNEVSILLHGEASAATYLIEEARKTSSMRKARVSRVGGKLYELGTKQMRESPPSTWKLLPQFGMLVCGLDKNAAGVLSPRCVGITTADGFWPHSYDKFAIKGKPLIANYLFAQGYKQEKSVNDLTKLVAQALYDTMNVDGDVGGDINIVIIDREGTRQVPARDLSDFINPWGRPLVYLVPNTEEPP